MASSCVVALASRCASSRAGSCGSGAGDLYLKATHGIFLLNVRTVTNPLRLTQAILAAFVQAGGRIGREEVRAFERDGDKASAVVTDQGRHACDLAVISAGAWSRRLVRMLGDAVPLEAERGYHIMIDEARVTPADPVVSDSTKAVV